MKRSPGVEHSAGRSDARTPERGHVNDDDIMNPTPTLRSLVQAASRRAGRHLLSPSIGATLFRARSCSGMALTDDDIQWWRRSGIDKNFRSCQSTSSEYDDFRPSKG